MFPHIAGNLGFAVFLALFSLLTIQATARYLALHSTYFDLGIFLNHFTNIASDQGWRLYFVHFQPLMLIYSWIDKLIPAGSLPVVILSMQAAVLAWPAAFLYRRFGVVPAAAFALYFPIWYNALFDFHMDHLAVPLLFGFFFMEKRGRIGLSVILAVLLALIKEPFALQTAACGLYLLIFRKHGLAGAALIIIGLSYFFAATHYLIPFFSLEIGGGLESPEFSWLGHGLTDMIWFIATKPHLVLGDIISDSGKTRYLFYTFGALAFIPLLRPGILTVALPIMAISLLSRRENHSGLFYHYTAGLIAPLIMAFAEGLPRAREIWSRLKFPKALFGPLLLLFLIIIHIKMAPSPISRVFWDKDSWAHSYQAYIPTHRDKMIKEAIRLYVPSDPKAAVSVQNTLNWDYLARRDSYSVFPVGVIEPYDVIQGSGSTFKNFMSFIKTGEMIPLETEKKWSDFVVLDLKRPWFLIDGGCPWKNGRCQNNETFSSRFLALVQQTKERFDTVFEEDGFYILKRKTLSKNLFSKETPGGLPKILPHFPEQTSYPIQ